MEIWTASPHAAVCYFELPEPALITLKKVHF